MDNSINRRKRIVTDLQRLREPPEPHLPKYDIRQDKANDINVIYTEMKGPKDSHYEGGHFVLRFEFTNDYPVSSPSVAFVTKVWHPNVDHNSGSVCLNSLNQNWQPTVNVRHILDTHMPWLLKNGNPDDPLNTDAGTQMKSKDPKYVNTVKQWVKKYANESHLATCGTTWYKDKPKKKKKKKKFSIAELTKSNTTPTPKTPDISTLPQPKPYGHHSRSPSKSMGHIEYSPKINGKIASHSTGENENDENKKEYNFQDWWSGSKILPNTPSKSGKPQIRRSQSFCVRPDSSPWMSKRQPMRRNTTDPMQWKDDIDDEDMNNMSNMKLISLDNDLEDKQRINLDENIINIPSKKQRKKKRKKNNNNHNNKGHILDIDIKDITSSILHDGDSDLSSMDEDPTYDLNQYQSLTSFDLTSINSKYNMKSSYHSSNYHSQTPSYNNINAHSSSSYMFNNTNQSRSCNDLYSRSAGFIPQSMDHFMCPEFSPLSPNIIHNHNIYSTQTERILHLSPAKNQQKVNTTLQFLNDNDNGNDTDIISDDNEDDDDDDVVPIPKNIDSNSNSNLKMNKKLKNIDVDMMDKTQNSSLQQTADSKTMLLD
mmetsp:Transcript_34386/g.30203  ORF Transcript_34386/g.30203 Transcript_34386/m.30203 type:complete len:596 (-) Transcript_34386:50-1837(-)|eukprot:CAMPEP_0201568638 /NCGR_PEP_ID=MMETSP0190_2-20130828/9838_1 /ASSEMBLY_ACC=CAM_ASM_000263 /TAXON_ID=37353 /ORGANISM="Rosalina sp." /LENGTH=595 /DNA_ID=CAMNT_0047989985 /DNA_START=40 /DNA_END=1827 /DNA_ORIENTATION=+